MSVRVINVLLLKSNGVHIVVASIVALRCSRCWSPSSNSKLLLEMNGFAAEPLCCLRSFICSITRDFNFSLSTFMSTLTPSFAAANCSLNVWCN